MCHPQREKICHRFQLKSCQNPLKHYYIQFGQKMDEIQLTMPKVFENNFFLNKLASFDVY